MKKIIYCLIFLLPVIFVNFGCEPEPVLEPEPEPEPELEQITDPRDGQVYWVVNLPWSSVGIPSYWMAENLNYEMEDSWWYNNSSSLGERYGRLYDWDSAKKACPPGWRLPTSEEIEKIVSYYGSEEQAHEVLIEGGSSGFNALLGGYRDPVGYYILLGAFGPYWSGTEVDTQHAWGYSFRRGSGAELALWSDGVKSYGHSCRCLQD